MFRSILAVSEGGPDAEMAFRLARRVAGLFDGCVDALHLAAGSRGSSIGAALWPSEEREARARKSGHAYREILASLPGTTYMSETNLPALEALVTMGRFSDVLVLGRPGADPANEEPAAIHAALYESGRPVMIAPPRLADGPFRSVMVAWNGTLEATRAIEYAMPFLLKASQVTILVVGHKPEDVGAGYLDRNFHRHGLNSRIAAVDPGLESGRARGRAILDHARDAAADLLVMGAYGGGRLKKFLGLGGATGKVISSCPVPVLMGH